MAEPIRLALAITELEPGGAERCLVNLATRLDRARFEPVVYSLGPRPDDHKAVLVHELEAARVPVRFLNLTHWSQFFRGAKQLADMLVEQRAQIVQSFLFHANVLGTRAAMRAGVKRVCTGIRVADPRRSRAAVERWATSRADRHICVSQSVADFCCSRRFAADKLVVIPNGIDVERWKNAVPADLARWGVVTGRRAIVYVGRLDRQKGLAKFFSTLPKLFSLLPNHDLVLVGEGSEENPLRRDAETRGFSDRVHFTGWQANVPAIVAACELLVLPSLWEGMPNALLEAMSAGKPVAATQTEGVAELLGEMASTQTVPPGDVDSLPSLVRRIVANSLLAKDLGRANQSRAEANYSLQAMVAGYESVFAELFPN